MFSGMEANEQLCAISMPLSKADKMKLFASKHISMKMNYHYAEDFLK